MNPQEGREEYRAELLEWLKTCPKVLYETRDNCEKYAILEQILIKYIEETK